MLIAFMRQLVLLRDNYEKLLLKQFNSNNIEVNNEKKT